MPQQSDEFYMRSALKLAARGYGATSPNPMVGAVLVKNHKIIGQGWHRRAGEPHAEIEALRDAERRRLNPKGATLYVTLEPCSTHGRTPPCTEALISSGIKRVVVAATDPNPAHAGRGFKILKRAGMEVVSGVLADEAEELNQAFNHWIVHRTPLVTVKAAMTLDGKIATASGESKWITGEKSRAHAMKLRLGSDAILAGVRTILADDPGLTYRGKESWKTAPKLLRRIILDPTARTPLSAKVVTDEFSPQTTIVVTESAAEDRVGALADTGAIVWIAPSRGGKINLEWLLKKLGSENVTSLLVEGGGETNARFFQQRLVQRVAFFYAPKILGGRDARKTVAGEGIARLEDKIALQKINWRRLGDDLLLTARVA